MASLWGGSQGGMNSLPPQGGYGEGMQHHGLLGMGPRLTGMSRQGGIHTPLQKRTGGGIQVGEHTGFLRVRGLPFSATRDDIFKFFLGYNPTQESVVLTYRNDGRATGEAYIGFATADDSKRAMELHRRVMGSRYVELFISNKDEHGRALARFGGR
jgi:heterogeneous nuclear ribonucleoprotein F/H